VSTGIGRIYGIRNVVRPISCAAFDPSGAGDDFPTDLRPHPAGESRPRRQIRFGINFAPRTLCAMRPDARRHTGELQSRGRFI